MGSSIGIFHPEDFTVQPWLRTTALSESYIFSFLSSLPPSFPSHYYRVVAPHLECTDTLMDCHLNLFTFLVLWAFQETTEHFLCKYFVMIQRFLKFYLINLSVVPGSNTNQRIPLQQNYFSSTFDGRNPISSPSLHLCVRRRHQEYAGG